MAGAFPRDDPGARCDGSQRSSARASASLERVQVPFAALSTARGGCGGRARSVGSLHLQSSLAWQEQKRDSCKRKMSGRLRVPRRRHWRWRPRRRREFPLGRSPHASRAGASARAPSPPASLRSACMRGRAAEDAPRKDAPPRGGRLRRAPHRGRAADRVPRRVHVDAPRRPRRPPRGHEGGSSRAPRRQARARARPAPRLGQFARVGGRRDVARDGRHGGRRRRARATRAGSRARRRAQPRGRAPPRVRRRRRRRGRAPRRVARGGDRPRLARVVVVIRGLSRRALRVLPRVLRRRVTNRGGGAAHGRADANAHSCAPNPSSTCRPNSPNASSTTSGPRRSPHSPRRIGTSIGRNPG